MDCLTPKRMAIGSLYNVFLALGYSFIVQNNSFSFLQYRNQKTQGTLSQGRPLCLSRVSHEEILSQPDLFIEDSAYSKDSASCERDFIFKFTPGPLQESIANSANWKDSVSWNMYLFFHAESLAGDPAGIKKMCFNYNNALARSVWGFSPFLTGRHEKLCREATKYLRYHLITFIVFFWAFEKMEMK